MMTLQTGQVIPLACGHSRTVAFNDPHDTDALFWCDRCDGLRKTGYGPHDIRSWTADEILLAVYAAGELWLSTGGQDPGDVLNDDQRELLDEAADTVGAEYYDVDPDRKTDPFRAWPSRSLALTLRAAGILWHGSGGADPNDVLSTVQKGRLDRAALLVLTAEDLALLSDEAPEPEPLTPGEALTIVYAAVPEDLRGGDVDRAMGILNAFVDRAIDESESV